jgi:hypothetical protein
MIIGLVAQMDGNRATFLSRYQQKRSGFHGIHGMIIGLVARMDGNRATFLSHCQQKRSGFHGIHGKCGIRWQRVCVIVATIKGGGWRVVGGA